MLPLLSYAVLRSSRVQTYLTQKIADYLSEKLKTEITISGVDISFFMNVMLEKVSINDLHHQKLLNAGQIKFNIKRINFSKNILSVKNVEMINTSIFLKIYKGEKNLNLQFIIDYFITTDTTKDNRAWKIKCNSIVLKNSSFAFNDLNHSDRPNPNEFNISDFTLHKINLLVKNLNIKNDTLRAAIQHFSCAGQNDFAVVELKTFIQVCSHEIRLDNFIASTKHSDLSMGAVLQFQSYQDFNDFIRKIRIHAIFFPSKVSLKDLAFFSSDLKGMKDKIDFSGEFDGRINNFRLKNIELQTGEKLDLIGDFHVNGLPDLNETFVHSNIKQLILSMNELNNFSLPTNLFASGHLTIPDNLMNLGNIRIKGLFTGFWYDFVSYGNFYTDIGEVSTNISFKRNKQKILEGKGKLTATNFDIGKLFETNNIIGKSSFHVDMSGSGFYPVSKTSAHLDGVIDSIEVKGYIYKNIILNGDLANKKFNGNISLNDNNVQMDFLGTIDYNGTQPVFDFSSSLRNVNLFNLHLIKQDSLLEFSSVLNFNFTGANIDEMVGKMSINNTKIINHFKKYNFDKTNISFSKDINNIRNINFRSDFADADFKGVFKFSELKYSFENFLNNYLPTLKTDNNSKQEPIPTTDFSYSIKLYNTQAICELFFPAIGIAENSIATGSFNSESNKFTSHFKSTSILIGNTKITNCTITSNSTDKLFQVNSSFDAISFAENIGIEHLKTSSTISHDSMYFNVNWDNYKTQNRNSGEIVGTAYISNQKKLALFFNKSTLIVNDSIWTTNLGNTIAIDSSMISISGLQWNSGTQHIALNGIISDNKSNKFYISFQNFNISNFDPLTNQRQIDFDGMFSGTIELSDIYHSPNFISELRIKDFGFNQGYLGDATISSAWDQTKHGLKLNMKINNQGNLGQYLPLTASGYFYPDKIKDNYDIDIDVNSLKLKSLERYFSIFSSQLNGVGTGKLRISGSTNHPELSGLVRTTVKDFKIDYLNTVYSFSTDVIISKNAFEFNHLILKDINGNSAVVSGMVTHQNFFKWYIDFNIQTDNILCLNTNRSMNNLFYGKGYASGHAKIYGPSENIFIEINARTEKGTTIAIPYGTANDLSESNFITFRTKDTTKKEIGKEINLSGIAMHCLLDVTPDAEIQIIFDEKIGDVIRGHGTANFEFNYNTSTDLTMFGEYTIQKGDYLFTLKNLINKKFEIERGGTILWNGNPYDAIVDLKAKYKLRASLYNLISGVIEDSSSLAKYKKRYLVECILGLQNKLFKPDISVDIKLPNIDEQTKRYVDLFINPENQQEMNKQLISLLLLNQFIQPDQSQRANLTSMGENAGATTSSELLFSQLSNWLSKLSGDMDIGVNYRPGTKLTTQEVEIALSKQFFNDQILIDGNIGTPLETDRSKNSSNIVGDVNIEYKIPPDGKFRLKAFNKSNHDDVLKEIYSPYTQGLGIFYRIDFDKISNLFERKKKKTEDQNKEIKN